MLHPVAPDDGTAPTNCFQFTESPYTFDVAATGPPYMLYAAGSRLPIREKVTEPCDPSDLTPSWSFTAGDLSLKLAVRRRIGDGRLHHEMGGIKPIFGNSSATLEGK